MEEKGFDFIVQEQFSFLESEYDFKIVESKKEDWGYEILYLNKKVGVRITYEYRESYIFILLYQLFNGKLIEDSRNIKVDSILNSYGLDDIVNLRDSSALMYPFYRYSDDSPYHNKSKGMSLYVSAFARNLKTYANDVLRGDFSTFPILNKIVKERIKKYR